MISILFTILKILGIFLLIVLGIILALVFLVLFVPVRYRMNAYRKTTEETPVVAEIKITWLFHILNAAFSYPKAAYVRVRVFCFTVFSTGREHTEKKPRSGKKGTKEQKDTDSSRNFEADQGKQSAQEDGKYTAYGKDLMENTNREQDKGSEETEQIQDNERPEDEPKETLADFIKHIWSALKNIKYTITKICDKIKHIIKNIRYYIKIIKSNTFHRAWTVCSVQAVSLLKGILPNKIKGNLLIGTGDPASTGQVLSVYGILYPLLGNHINITPDFEQQVLEGELFIKGKITLFKAVKTAGIVYFNKDLRRLIKLFKREAA